MPKKPLFQIAYEIMMKQQGYDPVGIHAWENQGSDLRKDWEVTTLAVIEEFDRRMKEALSNG